VCTTEGYEEFEVCTTITPLVTWAIAMIEGEVRLRKVIESLKVEERAIFGLLES